MSGIDIIDGTPILDIKPYIARYDEPSLAYATMLESDLRDSSNTDSEKLAYYEDNNTTMTPARDISSPSSTFNKNKVTDEHCSKEEVIHLPDPCTVDSKAASWISQSLVKQLDVNFTPNAQTQLRQFSFSSADPKYKLDYLQDVQDLQRAITDILKADPRSTYRRKHCDDRLYFFVVDKAHITSWFDDSCVEVVRIKSVYDIDNANYKNFRHSEKPNSEEK